MSHRKTVARRIARTVRRWLPGRAEHRRRGRGRRGPVSAARPRGGAEHGHRGELARE